MEYLVMGYIETSHLGRGEIREGNNFRKGPPTEKRQLRLAYLIQNKGI